MVFAQLTNTRQVASAPVEIGCTCANRCVCLLFFYIETERMKIGTGSPPKFLKWKLAGFRRDGDRHHTVVVRRRHGRHDRRSSASRRPRRPNPRSFWWRWLVAQKHPQIYRLRVLVFQGHSQNETLERTSAQRAEGKTSLIQVVQTRWFRRVA